MLSRHFGRFSRKLSAKDVKAAIDKRHKTIGPSLDDVFADAAGAIDDALKLHVRMLNEGKSVVNENQFMCSFHDLKAPGLKMPGLHDKIVEYGAGLGFTASKNMMGGYTFVMNA